MQEKLIEQAAERIISSKHTFAFTGAGISVESGIPTYRGEGGVWETNDPQVLELDYFMANPRKAWRDIRDKFYVYFGKCKPNAAHDALAVLEKLGLLNAIVTQNIDHLHQDAGNTNVHEFHGTMHSLTCVACGEKVLAEKTNMETLPPTCPHCSKPNNFLKPDFVFFGEGIPENAYTESMQNAAKADVCLVVGTSGLVVPAATIPHFAKQHGATVIEINLDKSAYTTDITDIFLQGKATEVLSKLTEAIKRKF